jgi:poly(A) polymerase
VVLPALGQALEAGGEEGRKGFHAHLAALDQLVRGGEEVSEAVLLGSLLMHLRRGGDGDAGADGLLTALVQTARLPRRVAERTRLALGAQRLLHGPPRRRRRRGGGVAGQGYFRDAVQLLEMTVRATGDGAEALDRWKAQGEARLREAAPERPDGDRPGRPEAAPAPAAAGSPGGTGAEGAVPGDEPGRRRRRRRGGRRRRRRGQGASGGGVAPSPPAATVGSRG